ncbi:MAG: hypothetical protein HY057_04900 [Rhodospirillales bacterium]|nr:hypothetical protein [Rhodospirillales bacterium]
MQILTEIDAVTATVIAARRWIDGGNMLDLSGLDNRVDALCRATAILTPPEGKAFMPALGDLAQALDDLAASLQNASSGKGS